MACQGMTEAAPAPRWDSLRLRETGQLSEELGPSSVKVLGVVPLGQALDEGVRGHSGAVSSAPCSVVIHPTPSGREGTWKNTSGHTQIKGLFFFRATMVEFATL